MLDLQVYDLNCTPTISQFFRSSNHGTLSDGNPYTAENGGYAKSGPPPTVDMVTEQQFGTVDGEAIPTYSTEDKSKKKDKTKDKKATEPKQTEDQYAVVDKTKKKRKKKRKKKKSELDDTYPEVDMSMKSKKVRLPMILVFLVNLLVTQVVCLYLLCFAILQAALLCPLFLLTSIPLKLKLLRFLP